MKSANTEYCQYLKDKEGLVVWPLPAGAEMLRKELSDSDIKKLMKWALKRLEVNPTEFYSPCRRGDLVEARCIIAYSLFSLGVDRRKISEVLQRDRSTVQNLMYMTIKKWGEKLAPVSGLVFAYKLWRLDREELNIYYKAKKSKRRGK